MRVKYILIFDAAVLLVVALGCLFDMRWVHSMFGIGQVQDSIFFCQLLGAAVFGLALQNWLARNIESMAKLRVIILANFFGHGAACVVMLANKLNGAGDYVTWLGIGYTFVATLVYGYFLDRPQVQSRHA